jgi:NAD(P)-dependent dehydrogenase (short-subunit alcohol dehydrogenase family)
MRLDGKTIAITGGARGLGAAMAVVWAKEFARYGIRAASIAPGFIATEMVQAMKPEARDNSGRCIEVDGALRL